MCMFSILLWDLDPLQRHSATTRVLVLDERLRVPDLLGLSLLEEGRRLLERHLWSVEERVHGQVLERGGRLHRDLGCTWNRGCFWLYGQGEPMQVCMR